MLTSLLRSGMDYREIIIYLLLFIPIFLISFSVHEAAHAYTAWKLGDPTARNLGRLTLNPLKHLDPIGTVAMLLIGIGYGKAGFRSIQDILRSPSGIWRSALRRDLFPTYCWR